MKKKTIKIIVDTLMLIFMVLEYSKLYTGQLIHELIGILLLFLFITHNLININFYKGLSKGKYNLSRLIITIVDITFLLCMFFTITLGIPISQKVFKFLNINSNMTIHKLHNIFGYWSMIILSIHLGLHFKMIFIKLKSKVKEKNILKIILYCMQIIIVIYGIKTAIDINLCDYLTGKASFAIPTSLFLSLLNNLIVIAAISIIIYNIEKLVIKKERKK